MELSKNQWQILSGGAQGVDIALLKQEKASLIFEYLWSATVVLYKFADIRHAIFVRVVSCLALCPVTEALNLEGINQFAALFYMYNVHCAQITGPNLCVVYKWSTLVQTQVVAL